MQLKSEDKPLFTFDASAIGNAVKALHRSKKFTPEMLGQKEGRALINEGYRLLATAIDRGATAAESAGLAHEVPAALTAALKENAFIFSGFKAYHTMREAGLSLVDESGGVKPFEQFEREAGEVFKKQQLNLQAEYRYATQAAQMAVKWGDMAADGDCYDLQYRTAGDDRVREEHAALNGTTLPPSDPFWQKYYPPNGWGCRCNVVQVRKGKYPRSSSEAATTLGDEATAEPKQQLFRFNAGERQKIFPAKHPYFPKGCEGCDKTLSLAYGKGRPECKACKIIQAMRSSSAKATRSWAKKNIQGRTATHAELPEAIQITGGGIREFTNQPHKHFFEKNELLKDIQKVIRGAEYKGVTEYKGRKSHIFEVVIMGEKSWIIANENAVGDIQLYSISDSDKVAVGAKK